MVDPIHIKDSHAICLDLKIYVMVKKHDLKKGICHSMKPNFNAVMQIGTTLF